MNLRPFAFGLLAVALSGAMMNAVLAQPPGGPGRGPGGFGGGGFGGGGFGGGPGGGGQMALLANEKVQAELELIDDQKKDFEALRNEIREKVGALFTGMTREMSREDREALMKEKQPELDKLTAEYQEKFKGLLLPHQQERLREVFVQVRGPAALADADVAAALKLSDAQQTELKGIREEMGKKMGELFQGFGFGRPRGEGNTPRPEGDPREKAEALRNESNEKALAVLTAEQRDEFEKIKGEKFDFDPNDFRPGGGRGPGGPGQGRPGEGRPGQQRPGQQRPGADRPAEGVRPESEKGSDT